MSGTGLTPLLLPQDLRLTPEQFALVCEANPDAVLELAADGQLITMTPTGGETGARNFNLGLALGLAARQCSLPVQLFDSFTGFRLADGSVLSPDLAVVKLDRWQALNPEQRRTFPPLCPDLVIELASAFDSGPRGPEALRRKMALFLKPMDPSWGGCCSLSSGLWRSGRPARKPAWPRRHSGWRTPRAWRAAPCCRDWRCSWRRSGSRRERWDASQAKTALPI